MKIQYISDIHLELLHANIIKVFCSSIKPKADICILSGDIGNPMQSNSNYKDFLTHISEKFKKTFLIAGNHEFYGNKIDETINTIKEICDNITNITFLNNSYEDYNGYRFIGSTQWTKIKDSRFVINDFSQIKELNVDKYNEMHNESSNFLRNTIGNSPKQCVVITHHLPIYELTDHKYRNPFFSKYSQCFNADLDDIVNDNETLITGWFFGHTHTRIYQKHYGVRFFCNPIGYSNENYYTDVNMICDI